MSLDLIHIHLYVLICLLIYIKLSSLFSFVTFFHEMQFSKNYIQILNVIDHLILCLL